MLHLAFDATNHTRVAAKSRSPATKVREAIGQLEEFRTALISAAVTGKIDVREEVT